MIVLIHVYDPTFTIKEHVDTKPETEQYFWGSNGIEPNFFV